MGLRLRLPDLPWATLRVINVYCSGVFYALGLNLMFGTALWSAYKNSTLQIGFVDWIPFILASLGMALGNSVNKSIVNSGVLFGYEHSGNIKKQARTVLILGSVLWSGCAVGWLLVIFRYIVPDRSDSESLLGIATLLSTVCVVISSLLLWLSQVGDKLMARYSTQAQSIPKYPLHPLQNSILKQA